MDGESREERDARIRSSWDQLDTRNEGHSDIIALRRGLRKIDHPLKNADSLIEDVSDAADINNDGVVTYDEFRKFVYETERESWSSFRSIDKDQNGKLDKAELKAGFVRAGLAVPNSRLDQFFNDVDTNDDGVIDFEEWRDFLLFMPSNSPGLKAVLSYYQSAVKLTAEGDVSLSDEAIHGLGTKAFLTRSLFGAITQIAFRPTQAYDTMHASTTTSFAPDALESPSSSFDSDDFAQLDATSDSQQSSLYKFWAMSTDFVPDPGYFLAGGLSGVASRTTTAPLDRLKVYLIAQTGVAQEAVNAAKHGAGIQATKHGAHTLINACKDSWAAGGIRSLFAGNGLNVVKVMPESAVKFGSYEAAKRVVAKIEGHGDSKKISSVSQFVAGGVAGMISQAVVYPLDTSKFRMQCETVPGGLRGNRLIWDTAKKMWAHNGIRAFYRGLPMGIAGMFPYASIDLGTFEYLKRTLTARSIKKNGGHEEDAAPGNFTLAIIGGFSGAIGASAVYPMNLSRTRLQSQGTASHPRTYTGIVDVTRKTIQGEGIRGLFKGLTPNLLKVVPAVSITYVVYENTKKALHSK